jgi:toxin ParE1/3/4
MSPSFSKSLQARADLLDIFVHIGEDSLTSADRFLEAAESTFQRLAENPHIGNVCGFGGDFADLRRWPVRGFETYLIFYRVRGQVVEIIRVLHGARDIEAMFETEP